MGSDDTSDKDKGPESADGQEAEHGGGVWQDLARMEAELQDPEEEATQLYSRDDLANMISADQRAALAAALTSGPSIARGPSADEVPASTTLPIDEGDEDETLHHDAEADDDETRHFLEGPESATLLEEEPAPTQARPQPAEAPPAAKAQDLASTVAIDAGDFADLSFDEVAVAATDLAATVALDAAVVPEAAEAAEAPAPAPSAKVAVARVALAKVPASKAKPAAPASPSPVRTKASDDEATLLGRAPRHKPSDYLRSATLSSPPPRRRRSGDTWSIVLVAALVALAASLVFLWMRLA